ncbi:hypothetical protein RKD23_001155 [Streptomyces sp. SAI-170]|uniref:hypothetical protein n=1 Tax=Streptomyces sp. SAI-170 TaxID=3377729 RepID=UPI003C7AFE07
MEELGTGRALAAYSPELLRSLVTAYYVEEPPENLDPFEGVFDDGIRRHHWRGSIVRMAAYYRGPFLIMLRVGFREGGAVIKAMLNAAARSRVAGLIAPAYGTDERGNADDYEVRFTFGATEYRLPGDEHVWAWYRGISIGPFPCTSALQALEFVCEQFIARGVPPAALVPLLLVANPPLNGPSNPLEAPAAVAAHVVQRALIHGDQLSADDVRWAADLLLAVVEQAVPERMDDSGFSIFSWGADRSAARALSLLLLPRAAHLRQALNLDEAQGQQRLQDALQVLATRSALQVRLFLAAAFDSVWSTPC